MAITMKQNASQVQRKGLPPWAYHNQELYELECDLLIRRHWQVAGHIANLPAVGDYLTFDTVGERALIIRDKDNQIRAFHNLCRHRGSRLVTETQGHCPGSLVCPFHAWSYHLDGRLKRPAKPETLPELDPVEWGLKRLELEIWHGFIFVRFQAGPQPSMATIMARVEPLLVNYPLASLVQGDAITQQTSVAVNWKAIRDVDNEGYHVPKAHPSLMELYGTDYHDGDWQQGTSLSVGKITDKKARKWSVGRYKELVQKLAAPWSDIPKQWLYVGVFPNFVLGFYPDSVTFYQEIPVSLNSTRMRGGTYAYGNEDRTLKAARYLSGRIDQVTFEEDKLLTIWTNEAMQSSAFDGTMLSDLEAGVWQYHDLIRGQMPVTTLTQAPVAGTLKEVNHAMNTAKTY